LARTLRNSKLDSRSARLRLKTRREPYWAVIAPGCALGYRRGPGTWIAKYRSDDARRHYEAIGAADDTLDADGHAALSFAQAQEKARAFFRQKAREAAGDFSPTEGPYTVADALRDYFAARERKGHKSVPKDRYSADALIIPALGSIAVSKLSRLRIERWQEGLVNAGARVRTRDGESQQFRKPTGSPEDIRRRRATCNRVLAILKAALNLAHQNGKVAIPDAWERVEAYRNVAASRLRYLSDDESRRLINACPPDLRALVTAALLTGCRYGELARLTVEDFHTDAGTIHVRTSKSGRSRHVVLTTEGQEFFARQCLGMPPHDLLLTQSNRRQWGKSSYAKLLPAACAAAQIGNANFHSLRHTYASRLVMKGVPLSVVANQLGHAGIAMVEKHYGHLAPSYVAETVRAAFGELGIATDANVISIARPT
jgi:integrase